MTNFTWTPEIDAELTRLRGDGHSSSEIATALGHGITRNAVIGRAGRLHLARVPHKDHRSPDAVAKDALPKRRTPFKPPPKPARMKPPEPPPNEIDAAQFKALIELTLTTCRWPVNDGNPYLFCGHESADLAAGKPYCQAHRQMARRMPGAAE